MSNEEREGRGGVCELRAVHTTNGIRVPPRRERRKLPRIKMDRKGKMVIVALRGGVGATLCKRQGVLATDQSARRTGVGQDTRGSLGRWVKDAGRERDREKERDRWIEV